MEGDRMPEEKKKVENAAEKTREAVGKDIKKSAKAVEDLGKGIKKRTQEKRIKKASAPISKNLFTIDSPSVF